VSFRRLCAHCAKRSVEGRRSDAIYCSHRCNVAASKERRRLARLAGRETGQRSIERAIASLRPSARRVVRALEAAPGHQARTDQLSHALVGGVRFGARLQEIRQTLAPHGIEITAEQLPNHQWLYTLHLPQLRLGVDVPAGAPSPPAAEPSHRTATGSPSRAGGDVATSNGSAHAR
jgi:hypothetical protein